jgi:hypothetical protein
LPAAIYYKRITLGRSDVRWIALLLKVDCKLDNGSILNHSSRASNQEYSIRSLPPSSNFSGNIRESDIAWHCLSSFGNIYSGTLIPTGFITDDSERYPERELHNARISRVFDATELIEPGPRIRFRGELPKVPVVAWAADIRSLALLSLNWG